MVWSTVHVLTLAISTYIASRDIETILVSGWIGSITGLMLAIVAAHRSRFLLATAAALTPLIAVTLVVLESSFLHLGPARAATPFCIIFVINQAITTTAILVELHLQLSPPGKTRLQVTLKTLMVLMTALALSSGVAHFLLQQGHNVMMIIALGLLGLTVVGIVSVAHASYSRRNESAVQPLQHEECSDEDHVVRDAIGQRVLQTLPSTRSSCR